MKRETSMNDANQSDDYKQGVEKNQIKTTHFTRYLSSLVPIVKGDHIFNSDGDQEWRIESNSDVKFAVYGRSCRWIPGNSIMKNESTDRFFFFPLSFSSFVQVRILMVPKYRSQLTANLVDGNEKRKFIHWKLNSLQQMMQRLNEL